MAEAAYYEPVPDRQLMESFVPTWEHSFRIRDKLLPKIVSPDNPYIAIIEPDRAYFIDHRYSPSDAQYVKDQLEWAMSPPEDSCHKIDEIECTARVVRASTRETLFEFNPAYARVFFARGINRHNPSVKLPEHPSGGPRPWIKKYNHPDLAWLDQARSDCSSCKKSANGDSSRYSYLKDDGRRICKIKFDTPRYENETDTEYYQRMDRLHWCAPDTAV